MKNKIKINRGLALVMIMIITLATACLNDNRYYDYGSVAPTAEMIGASPGRATAFNLTGAAQDTILVKVNVTGANAPSHDVTLTLGVSQNAIDQYNTDASHVPGEMIPSNAYLIPATVTIKAGKDAFGNDNRSATFKVVLYEANIPNTPGHNFVLPIAITGASSGVIVSSNQSYVNYNFYHNPYDGSYNSTGVRWNFNVASDYTGWDFVNDQPLATSTIASTSPWNFPTSSVVTVNADNSMVHAGNLDGGFGTINVLVNADNTVTISSNCPANDGSCAAPLTGLANLYPLAGGPQSTWDPVNKTFKLYYQYTNSNGTFRVLKDVLVHNP